MDWLSAQIESPEVLTAVIAAGVLLVIGLLVLIFRRRPKKVAAPAVTTRTKTAGKSPTPAKPAATPNAAAAPKAAPEPAPVQAAPPLRADKQTAGERLVLAPSLTGDNQEWIRPNGNAPIGRIVDGRYQLGANQGVRTVQGLPVKSGETCKVSFSVQAVSDATNGGEQNFMVGPIFVDAEGRVVGWWALQPAISLADGARTGSVEALAPKSATQVYLGIHGSYNKSAPPGDSLVAFWELELSKAG